MVSVSTAVPDFFTLPEAGRILRIGRNSAYKAATEFERTGGLSGLPFVKVGKLKRVPRLALEKLHGGPITWPLVDEAADEPADEAAPLDDEADHLHAHDRDAATRDDESVRNAVELEPIDGLDQPSLPFEG